MDKLAQIALALFFALALMARPAAILAFQGDLQQQTKAFAEDGVGFGKPTDPRQVAGQVIRGLLGLTSILFLAYTVYAGYLYVSSAGDSDKIETAKKTIKYGVIGILITLSAWSILEFVNRFQRAQIEPDGLILEGNVTPYDQCLYGGGDKTSCAR